jgi:hypothetical protein
MELEGCRVVVYVNGEGFSELQPLLGLEGKDAGVAAVVTATDAFGVWLSVAGERWAQLLAAPWRYIRAFEIEFEPEQDAVSSEVKRRIGFRE